jgi:hypothetical protein
MYVITSLKHDRKPDFYTKGFIDLVINSKGTKRPNKEDLCTSIFHI